MPWQDNVEKLEENDILFKFLHFTYITRGSSSIYYRLAWHQEMFTSKYVISCACPIRKWTNKYHKGCQTRKKLGTASTKSEASLCYCFGIIIIIICGLMRHMYLGRNVIEPVCFPFDTAAAVPSKINPLKRRSDESKPYIRWKWMQPWWAHPCPCAWVPPSAAEDFKKKNFFEIRDYIRLDNFSLSLSLLSSVSHLSLHLSTSPTQGRSLGI